MWIQEYREREKLELWQFQQRVNMYGKKLAVPLYGTVSAALIHMLEVDENAVTQPRIANCIATLCGATSEQRDMIVADIHKGWWTGPSEEEQMIADEVNAFEFVKGVDYHKTAENEKVSAKQSKLKSEPPIPFKTKEVVKLDIAGNTIQRYESIDKAAAAEDISHCCITDRCMRRLKNEFRKIKRDGSKTKDMKFTFRYALEWDMMTNEEKIKDINRCQVKKVK